MNTASFSHFLSIVRTMKQHRNEFSSCTLSPPSRIRTLHLSHPTPLGTASLSPLVPPSDPPPSGRARRPPGCDARSGKPCPIHGHPLSPLSGKADVSYLNTKQMTQDGGASHRTDAFLCPSLGRGTQLTSKVVKCARARSVCTRCPPRFSVVVVVQWVPSWLAVKEGGCWPRGVPTRPNDGKQTGGNWDRPARFPALGKPLILPISPGRPGPSRRVW